MQCPNCSAENAGGNFCTNCGAPLPTSEKVESLKDAVLEPDAVEMPGEDTASDTYTPPTYDHAPGQSGATYVPPVGASGTDSTAPAYGTSSQGILNQAWDDLIHDPSFVKKSALLGLIELVPILNFVVLGYGLRWGRRAAFRTGDKLPEKIFGDRSFETGFYAFVVCLVWAIAIALVCIVPFVGWVAALGAVPFLILGMIYVALVEEIGAGFRISELWEKGKRSYGGILAAAYVPGLVLSLVISIITSVFGMMFGISTLGLYGASSTLSDAAIIGLGSFSFVFALIMCYLCSVLSVMATLITYRAIGYWVGRMAPEWIQECIEKGTDPR